MKRKIVSLLLLTTMIVTLVACGETTSTSNTPTSETQEDTQVSQNETQQQETTQEETFSDDMSLKFPSGMEGFTDKWIYANDETWSYNQTHYVDINGNVMDFKWEGPSELGLGAINSEFVLYLMSNPNNYQLGAWTYGYEDGDFENCINMSKDTWTSFAHASTPYIKDGYYDIKITDTTIKVIFAIEGAGWKGYDFYIIDLNKEACYQFSYTESVDVYNDERALKVINSIDFWDYEE